MMRLVENLVGGCMICCGMMGYCSLESWWRMCLIWFGFIDPKTVPKEFSSPSFFVWEESILRAAISALAVAHCRTPFPVQLIQLEGGGVVLS